MPTNTAKQVIFGDSPPRIWEVNLHPPNLGGMGLQRGVDMHGEKKRRHPSIQGRSKQLRSARKIRPISVVLYTSLS